MNSQARRVNNFDYAVNRLIMIPLSPFFLELSVPFRENLVLMAGSLRKETESLRK